MKIQASNLLIPLFCFYILSSVHVISELDSVNTLLRVFRLLTIPFLLLTIVVLLPRQPLSKLKHLIPLGLPLVILLSINLLQMVALPAAVVSTHITGSVKFTTWFLLYIAVMLSLNATTAESVRKYISWMLIAVFIVGILQYPIIILSAGGDLGKALTNYGQLGARFQLSGIFGSSNEDANGFVTLFPLVLLWIEQRRGNKRRLFRWLLLAYFPLILVFNGTRTALLISLPIVTVLFYWRVSLYWFLCMMGPLAAVGLTMVAMSERLVNRFFGAESQGGGSLGWRIEHAWKPAIDYTWSHSPLFGFGSRGWEFVAQHLGLIEPIYGEIIPAHSGYVWSFVAWGALGFCVYVAFLGVLLIETLRLSRSAIAAVALTGRSLFCSVVGYCLWASISNVMWPQGWLILTSLAVLTACLKIEALAGEQALKPPLESWAEPDLPVAAVHSLRASVDGNL